jgi:hypothetical protein
MDRDRLGEGPSSKGLFRKLLKIGLFSAKFVPLVLRLHFAYGLSNSKVEPEEPPFSAFSSRAKFCDLLDNHRFAPFKSRYRAAVEAHAAALPDVILQTHFRSVRTVTRRVCEEHLRWFRSRPRRFCSRCCFHVWPVRTRGPRSADRSHRGDGLSLLHGKGERFPPEGRESRSGRRTW